MRGKRSLWLLIGALLTLLLAGCAGSRDQVVLVPEDDADMEAAIVQARETLPHFWEVFERQDDSPTGFALKVRLEDPHGVEYFWLTDLERRDGETSGRIDNDPNIVRSVRLGQRMVIPEADISDWSYTRDGKIVGNFTMRALFKHMPEDEVARYRSLLADP